jgi:hypothetical protein
VNRYGTEAPEHWPAYLPGSYGRLEDPEEFFTELGEQADAENLRHSYNPDLGGLDDRFQGIACARARREPNVSM